MSAARAGLPAAAVFAALPDYFVSAADLLERLISCLTAAPGAGSRVLVFGHLNAALLDELAAFGAEIAEIEPGCDRESDGEP